LVLVPTQASPWDSELDQFLVDDLVDKHGLAHKTQEASRLPATGPFIQMGTAEDPLIREYLQSYGTEIVVRAPEGYLPEVDAHAVVIAAADEAGAS
jgi:hypothetical protein